MKLLSSYGERHEDRVPIKIVKDTKEAIAILRKAYPDCCIEKELVATDYDPLAFEIYVKEDMEDEVSDVFVLERIDDTKYLT